ncbi:MAG: hypothetical protein PHD46_07120, partial [Eubacteriales bacterium]|nr:hypothetical protein [Eubacteriales bacterium]
FVGKISKYAKATDEYTINFADGTQGIYKSDMIMPQEVKQAEEFAVGDQVFDAKKEELSGKITKIDGDKFTVEFDNPTRSKVYTKTQIAKVAPVETPMQEAQYNQYEMGMTPESREADIAHMQRLGYSEQEAIDFIDTLGTPEATQATPQPEITPMTSAKTLIGNEPTLAEQTKTNIPSVTQIRGAIDSLEKNRADIESGVKNIYKKWGFDSGDVEAYIVGGRAKGTKLKADSDIDVYLRITNPLKINADNIDNRTAAMEEIQKYIWSLDPNKGRDIHVLEFYGHAQPEGGIRLGDKLPDIESPQGQQVSEGVMRNMPERAIPEVKPTEIPQEQVVAKEPWYQNLKQRDLYVDTKNDIISPEISKGGIDDEQRFYGWLNSGGGVVLNDEKTANASSILFQHAPSKGRRGIIDSITAKVKSGERLSKEEAEGALAIFGRMADTSPERYIRSLNSILRQISGKDSLQEGTTIQGMEDRILELLQSSDANRVWESAKEQERGMVQQSLSEGRRIPDNVLADYPDLVKTTKKDVKLKTLPPIQVEVSNTARKSFITKYATSKESGADKINTIIAKVQHAYNVLATKYPEEAKKITSIKIRKLVDEDSAVGRASLANTKTGEICLSPEQADKETVEALAHEMLHLSGATEAEASAFEKTVLKPKAEATPEPQVATTEEPVNATLEEIPYDTIFEQAKKHDSAHNFISDIQVGDFIQDDSGLVRGIVKGKGKIGKLDSYKVDVGGGKISVIPAGNEYLINRGGFGRDSLLDIYKKAKEEATPTETKADIPKIANTAPSNATYQKISEDYYIGKQIEKGKSYVSEFVKVEGKPVKNEFGLDLFSTQDLKKQADTGGLYEKYTITEGKTGLRVGGGATLKEAIENANARLKNDKQKIIDSLNSAIENKGLSPRYQKVEQEAQVSNTPINKKYYVNVKGNFIERADAKELKNTEGLDLFYYKNDA